jgi:hypothetical protein
MEKRPFSQKISGHWICLMSPNGRYITVVDAGEPMIQIVDVETGKIGRIQPESSDAEIETGFGKYPLFDTPRWLSDSSGLTYTRTSNKGGKPSAELWLYDLKNDTNEEIAAKNGGILSPQRDKLAWVDPKEPQVLNVTVLKTGRTYSRSFGNVVDGTWSPDGNYVALVRQGLHSKVLISDYTLKGRYEILKSPPSPRYEIPLTWQE